ELLTRVSARGRGVISTAGPICLPLANMERKATAHVVESNHCYLVGTQPSCTVPWVLDLSSSELPSCLELFSDSPLRDPLCRPLTAIRMRPASLLARFASQALPWEIRREGRDVKEQGIWETQTGISHCLTR